ncbi:WD40/YVTN/BNR-like repeat-containing protein [Pseudomonas sp.]|uniref:WD40/YVTN/BNR-like repeat-containing protein n=1 Tax=Pseudomonas sp. TaxID=306 RepID=UPI003D6F1CE2
MQYAISLLGALFCMVFPLTTLQAEPLKAVPAVVTDNASSAVMLDAKWAKDHIVAVGDHGVVLISNDQGVAFHQASAVPLSTPLTGVSFADAQHGWAVGQWGAILASSDGGDSWQVQRLSSNKDRPLFAIHFFNVRQGVAVGLWSLVLTTDDGGQTWTEQTLDTPSGSSRADLNLMGLFANGEGAVFATAERGQVLRSDDFGNSWRYLDTGYEGTLWSGAVLADGSLLVGGQRGTLLHGSAKGEDWHRVPLERKSSITSIAVSGPHVVVAGLDGLMVRSDNGGQDFQEQLVANGVSLTAVVLGDEKQPILFSRRGVLTVQPR